MKVARPSWLRPDEIASRTLALHFIFSDAFRLACPNTHSPEKSNGIADFARRFSETGATFLCICRAVTDVSRAGVIRCCIYKTDKMFLTRRLHLPASSGVWTKRPSD